MKLTFYGGTDTVTGSRYLVEGDGGRGLVDCGLFQGLKELRLRNWDAFPVVPASLQWVALTHGHIDHSGYLPALVKNGFRGRIYCSAATADLLGILLVDAAHLQEEEADFANRHGTSRHEPAEPLYTREDVEATLQLLTPVPLETDRVVQGFVLRFRAVGHILGATMVRVTEAGGRSVLFTGDVGRPDDPVLPAPLPALPADVMVLESTYGNRRHPAVDPADELAAAVNDGLARGGRVLVPSFAVGRAQQLLLLLARLRDAGRIPKIPIYLNSPMAVDATELLGRHPEAHRLDAADSARVANVARLVKTTDESKSLNNLDGPMIILSASGMATGGRVLHHLVQMLPDPKNTVIFTGFQAPGTRGDALVGGIDEIKIFGRYVKVAAKVVQLSSLSAHADWHEMIAWLRTAERPPERVLLVHGEPAARDGMRRAVRDFLGWEVELPRHGQQVTP